MPPVIDYDKCLECDICTAIEDCPQDVFAEGVLDEPVTVVDNPRDCINCGTCVDVCNNGAITLY